MASKNARSASVRTPTKLKRKGHPQTNPNSLANLKPPWRAGDPSPNPSGKPKLLGEAYKKYLALPPNPKFVALLSDWGDVPKTNAELIAARAILDAASGNDGARREIRSATEGEKLAVRGEIELFNHDLISQLLARRPSGDHSESESD